jgi:hypothetical protein
LHPLVNIPFIPFSFQMLIFHPMLLFPSEIQTSMSFSHSQ